MINKPTRAALLPFPGDPFLLTYWLTNFDTWAQQIDKLYIYLNSTIEKPMVDYIYDLCSVRGDKVQLIYRNVQIEHGDAINAMLDLVTEDFIMLIEDDTFIIRPGALNEAFEALESGRADVVGSKRGSASMEILTEAKRLWGLNYEGEGDQGPNFWPSLFFCSPSLLKATDRNFAARAWKRGEGIEWLNGYIVQGDVAPGDTFVNTSLQIHKMVPESRILYIPQYHGHPQDLEHYEQRKYLFDGQAPWTHIGSLSSGVGGLLMDDQNRALTRRLIDPPRGPTQLNLAWCQTDMERGEFERRVQWWLTFWEKAKPITDKYGGEVSAFHTLYGNAIVRIIEQYKLSLKTIKRRQEAYSTLGL